MARLLYSTSVSLDGYVADEHGSFAWTAPDAEVHAAVNDLLRPVGTHLYGRRLYEVMVAWETVDTGPDQPAVTRDFARMWRAVDKIVYSRTLRQVSSTRTRLEPAFDPAAVRRWARSADRDLLVGGAELAGQALRAGVVDDLHLFVVPVVVGAGTRALPAGLRRPLDLVGVRRFASGTVHLHYRPGGGDDDQVS